MRTPPGAQGSVSDAAIEARLRQLEKTVQQIATRQFVPQKFSARRTITIEGFLGFGENWVRMEGGVWVPAFCSPNLPVDLPVAQVVGCISQDLGGDRYEIVTAGYVKTLFYHDGISELLEPGVTYYLESDPAKAGQMTKEPLHALRVQVLVAISETEGFVLIQDQSQGLIQPATPELDAGVYTDEDVLADADVVTDANTLRLVTGPGATFQGWVDYPDSELNTFWLDPANPGQMVTDRPYAEMGGPAIRPVRLMRGNGSGMAYWSPQFEPGMQDLWDVDRTFAPQMGVFMWFNDDAGAKRWMTTNAPSAGDTPVWDGELWLMQPAVTPGDYNITLDSLIKIGPLSLLGNNSDVDPAEVVEIPASPDAGVGQAFVRRTDDTLGFSEEVHLSSIGDGIGVLKVWFAPGKYVLIDTDGLDIYCGTDARIQIEADGTLTATYDGNNTVSCGVADFGSDTNQEVKPRKLDDCNGAGTPGYRYVMCSAFFT